MPFVFCLLLVSVANCVVGDNKVYFSDAKTPPILTDFWLDTLFFTQTYATAEIRANHETSILLINQALGPH